MALPALNELTYSRVHEHPGGRTHYCVILAKVPLGVGITKASDNLTQLTHLSH